METHEWLSKLRALMHCAPESPTVRQLGRLYIQEHLAKPPSDVDEVDRLWNRFMVVENFHSRPINCSQEHPKPSFTLWLEFKKWADWEPDQEPDAEQHFNMMITLDTGHEFALNVWTFACLEAIRCQSGELGQQYIPLKGPDLLVERMERGHIENIVSKLLLQGELNPRWLCSDLEQDD